MSTRRITSKKILPAPESESDEEQKEQTIPEPIPFKKSNTKRVTAVPKEPKNDDKTLNKETPKKRVTRKLIIEKPKENIDEDDNDPMDINEDNKSDPHDSSSNEVRDEDKDSNYEQNDNNDNKTSKQSSMKTVNSKTNKKMAVTSSSKTSKFLSKPKDDENLSDNEREARAFMNGDISFIKTKNTRKTTRKAKVEDDSDND